MRGIWVGFLVFGAILVMACQANATAFVKLTSPTAVSTNATGWENPFGINASLGQFVNITTTGNITAPGALFNNTISGSLYVNMINENGQRPWFVADDVNTANPDFHVNISIEPNADVATEKVVFRDWVGSSWISSSAGDLTLQTGDLATGGINHVSKYNNFYSDQMYWLDTQSSRYFMYLDDSGLFVGDPFGLYTKITNNSICNSTACFTLSQLNQTPDLTPYALNSTLSKMAWNQTNTTYAAKNATGWLNEFGYNGSFGSFQNISTGSIATTGNINATNITAQYVTATAGGRTIGFDAMGGGVTSVASSTSTYFVVGGVTTAYMDSTQVSYYDNKYMRLGVAGTAGMAPRMWGDYAYQTNATAGNRMDSFVIGLPSVDYSAAAKLWASRNMIIMDADAMTTNLKLPVKLNPTATWMSADEKMYSEVSARYSNMTNLTTDNLTVTGNGTFAQLIAPMLNSTSISTNHINASAINGITDNISFANGWKIQNTTSSLLLWNNTDKIAVNISNRGDILATTINATRVYAGNFTHWISMDMKTSTLARITTTATAISLDGKALSTTGSGTFDSVSTNTVYGGEIRGTAFTANANSGVTDTYDDGIDTTIDFNVGIAISVSTAFDGKLMDNVTYLGSSPVTTLTPISFNWNEKGLKQFSAPKTDKVVGYYLAQDVLMFYPDCVLTTELKEFANGIQTKTGETAITYNRNCVSVRMSEDMRQQIYELNEQNKALQSKLDKLCAANKGVC